LEPQRVKGENEIMKSMKLSLIAMFLLVCFVAAPMANAEGHHHHHHHHHHRR
jgi:hypothetical protein